MNVFSRFISRLDIAEGRTSKLENEYLYICKTIQNAIQRENNEGTKEIINYNK